MTAGVSCVYLTQCTTPNHLQKEPTVAPTKGIFNYPVTRTHQDGYDNFLSGEYGRPADLPTRGDSYAFLRPDDGVDNYFDEKVVDKYRWLEEVDVISPEYAKETSADRERNFIGTRAENDVPDGRFSNRTTKALQTVNTPKSSEVNDWVNAQNAATLQYLQTIPYYNEVRQNIDSLMGRHHYLRKVKKDKLGEIYLFQHEDGFHHITYTDLDGNVKEIFNEKEYSKDKPLYILDRDMYVSKDGSYVALLLTDGNADSNKISLHVLDVKTGQDVTTPISPISRHGNGVLWLDDKSFLYLGVDSSNWISVLRHDVGVKRFNDPVEVAAHHLGESATLKSIEFEGEGNRYLLIESWHGFDSFYIKDRKTNKVYQIHTQKQANAVKNNDAFTPVLIAKFVHLDEKTGDIWFISGENAGLKGEIIKSNLENLKKREVVVSASTEYDQILEATYHGVGEGYFLIEYRKDGVSRMVVTDAKGNKIKDITPLEAGEGSDLYSHIAGKKDSDNTDDASKLAVSEKDESYVSFRFQNTVTPRTVYKYSIEKGEFIDVRRRDLHPFDQNAFETKLVKYTSKDGTQGCGRF